jgi:hypothetical protein
LATCAGRARRVGRLDFIRTIDGDVIFLLHALDQLFDQLIELTVHRHLQHALAHLFVELLAVH